MVAALGPRFRRGDRPVVLGHRGARHAAPENTFAAFDLALSEGAEGVELDVRLNASGDVMVCHDATLERVTEGRDRRRLAELSSAECERVRLAGGERLPRLADVLDWAEQNGGALVNVEIKVDGVKDARLVQSVARLLVARPDRSHLLVSCFSAAALLAHRFLAPEIASAWLVESGRRVDLPGVERLGGAAIHPQASLVTPERVQRWQRSQRGVHVWTVNDPERALALARAGVTCLISDRPGALVAALAGQVIDRTGRGAAPRGQEPAAG